jgi:hypothetical protein
MMHMYLNSMSALYFTLTFNSAVSFPISFLIHNYSDVRNSQRRALELCLVSV